MKLESLLNVTVEAAAGFQALSSHFNLDAAYQLNAVRFLFCNMEQAVSEHPPYLLNAHS
ncbi:MAG: hypothetical protein ACLGIS_13415 [Actinomycetes bacterium]